jgi:hypothetical protein
MISSSAVTLFEIPVVYFIIIIILIIILYLLYKRFKK